MAEAKRQFDTSFDPAACRAQFPILQTQVNGEPLTYLDSGASSQKPQCVIDALTDFYTTSYANIHRGVHTLGSKATQAFEDARQQVATTIGAETESIIFTRGGTEAINLVAHSWARQQLSAGDEIAVSTQEHHANIVPWQQACQETGAKLRVIPLTDNGDVNLTALEEALTSGKVKLVALAHLSNVTGALLPAKRVAELCRQYGAKLLLDGCQAVPRLPVDVQALDADFYVFSGHKCYAPSGIGALYARSEILAEMPPYQTGGDMIDSVSFEGTTFAAPPARFEAGTPFIEGAVALGTALSWLTNFDLGAVWAHEQDLTAQTHAMLERLGYITYFNPAEAGGAVAFNHPRGHAHDVATLLDECGVAVRSGHHCAEPLHQSIGVDSTVRASFGIYTTSDDITRLGAALERVNRVLGHAKS